MENNQVGIELALSRLYESKKIRKAVIAILVAGFFVCLAFLLPPVQNAIVALILSHIHRTVSTFQERLYSLLSLPIVGFMFCAICLCALFSNKISNFLSADKNTKKIVTSAFLVYIAVLAFIFVFTYLCGYQWLNSDHSSEMVLGNLLAGENSFVSPNWMYSTELRLVYQTIFTMPLFKILGGLNNWELIRSLNIILNIFVLTASYIYLTRQLRITIKWIMLTSIFLLLPISLEYWDFVLFGGYYIFFVAQLFYFLGLFFSILQQQSRLHLKSGTIINLLFFLILSIVLGIQGIRALMSVQIPLLLACIYAHFSGISNNKRTPLFLGVSSFILCCIGFFINNLLRFKYCFVSFDKMRIDNLYDSLLEKISESIYGIIQFFGFSSGVYILSANGILGILGLFITTAVFIAAWKISFTNKAGRTSGDNFCFRFLALFFIISTFFIIFLLTLVNDTVTARYFIPSLVIIFPLTAIVFERAELISVSLKRVMVLCLIAVFFIGLALVNFQSMIRQDVNSKRMGYIQYLEKEKLNYGFASYWNANVTTELSNGQIEIAGLGPDGLDGTTKKIHIQLMLNRVEYFDSSYHKGKESFLLLTRDEWNLAESMNRSFAKRTPDYADEHFIVIKYSHTENLYSEVLDYENY
jgi:hypothetical protein